IQHGPDRRSKAEETMFDVSWSELLILAIVTLVFVGPKELPVFLGTLGRYAGMVRKQAGEFRRHFDDAMREAELDQMQKDVETLARDVNESVMSASHAAEAEVSGAKASLNRALPPSDSTVPQTVTAATAEAPQITLPSARTADGHG
ncbi:MAG: Sec-independent protein translocase protein TatB, partial [Hyphomicrobium sp.]